MKLVKTDSKLTDLIGRLERNLANLASLSQKAYKHLSKLVDARSSEDDVATLQKSYDSLAAYAGKIE